MSGDTYTYSPDPINPNGTFNLTYRAAKILAPVGNYDLLSSDNTIISNFSPIYTFCKGTGICNPNGIDTDINGNLYIVNSTNSVIFLNVSTKESTSILTLLNYPSNIYFDKTNNCFYLILQGNGSDNSGSINKYILSNGIWILDTSFTTITNINSPQNLTIGNNNILYVSNTNLQGSIPQISTYNLLTSSLINNSIISGLNQVNTLSFDINNNILYYSNTNNNNLTQSIGKATINNLGVPISINNNWSTNYQYVLYSVFSNTFLYIIDLDINTNIGTIYKIASNGTHTQIKNNISTPLGITVNPTNQNIYYASDLYQINSLNSLNVQTNIVNSITGINGPTGIVFVSNRVYVSSETLFVVNNLNQSISAVDSTGVVTEFVSYSDGLQGPYGITFGDKYLYVTQQDGNLVSEINKNGIIKNIDVSPDSFNNPKCIVYNSIFNLFYITESDINGNSILTSLELKSNKGIRRVVLDSNNCLNNSGGIWFDSNNVLYICNSVDPGFISKCTFNNDGSVKDFNLNYQIQNLNNPAGIVSDDLNNLYIANFYTNLSTPIGGEISLSAAVPDSIVPQPPPSIPTVFGNSSLIQNPIGVALDLTGNLFTTNSTTFSILKLNTHELNFVNILGSSLKQNSINSLHINDPFNLEPIYVAVACFAKGTSILTTNGYINVENLQKEDIIRTFGKIKRYDNYVYKIVNKYENISKIISVGKKMFQKIDNDKKPIVILKNAFENNEPFCDTYLSKQHLITHNNRLDHSKNWVNNTTIFENSLLMNIEYYHILLEDYYLVNANNILCESYYGDISTDKSFDLIF
jgi:hypothetical protein